MTEPVTYDPPVPNAALVVGPDDVLVLSFPGVPTDGEVDRFRGAIEAVGLKGRVLVAWDAQISVVLADNPPELASVPPA